MNEVKRRSLSFLLILLLLLPLCLLTGCGEKKVEEGEVLAAARELIAAAEPLNEVYFGTGMPVGENAGYGKDAPYYHVPDDYLALVGFSTVEELKEKTRAVYTAEFRAVLFPRIFESTDAQENIPYNTPYGLSGIDCCPEAWENAGNDLLDGARDEFLTDTLRVNETGSKNAVVTLSVRVTSRSGSTETQELRLPMVLTDDGWRLDMQTAVAFSGDE